MNDILTGIQQAAVAMSIWEIIAVALGIAYLLLAMKQNILCWYAAFFSTIIFIWLFWDVSLLMDSALNVYYLIMAVYGWWQWRRGVTQPELPISVWSARRHLLVIAGVIAASLVSGWLLSHYTSAAYPYWDSFTSWGAVVTTYMVARKVLENWLYWIVIDTIAGILYFNKELYLTSALMVVYVILVIIGWFRWLPQYKAQNRHDNPDSDHKLATPAAWQVGEKLP
ncbi:MAG: nicotinamide mononucleotide transporter [Oceanospirillaceae bacterium]|nr:nicotinamide mononucleotide transporter [Oceanospirillaceae bacterium]MBT12253.1 nicotinamide mononucleotide transporter [Oceanospirillaceae bacterium]|tara:strand:+ start:5749 stop:6423 length:675 start_codon:yes stop_codon:yes gene_type:complete